MADVPLQVISENAAAERRITPSWTITQLRAKLEPITGIPPSSQTLSLKVSGSERIPIEAQDEDAVQISAFPIAPYAELHVSEAIAFHLSRDSLVRDQESSSAYDENDSTLGFPRALPYSDNGGVMLGT